MKNQGTETGKTPKLNQLSAEEKRVILNKGTDMPFKGKYDSFFEPGYYTCRQCGALLYRSDDKFKGHCGWPSFEDALPDAVKKTKDADGIRTEITCTHCGGHLGHIFEGENLTPKSTRHCVNSTSLVFEPANSEKFGRAIFAGGCFWGVEYYMLKAPGVLAVTPGYAGGKTEYPDYEEVCAGKGGHVEAVEIVYDREKTDFEKLAKLFMEIHDPTQLNRQGPDIGFQYRSVIFYFDDAQKKTAVKLIEILKSKGLNIATTVEPAKKFWPAEEYHRNYYDRKKSLPYCHGYTKRF
ncbi:MAG: peptide-methionine (S)-S-oxide reductase [Lentisphaerae bacterium GWF2_45_14]|nr:MAG: peptide-methionine (S)-S-oxide reductase [Lentisphaerae bacterium GWF2_45_14]